VLTEGAGGASDPTDDAPLETTQVKGLAFDENDAEADETAGEDVVEAEVDVLATQIDPEGVDDGPSALDVEERSQDREAGEAVDTTVTKASAGRVPFYKREVSFRRKSAAASAAAVVESDGEPDDPSEAMPAVDEGLELSRDLPIASTLEPEPANEPTVAIGVDPDGSAEREPEIVAEAGEMESDSTDDAATDDAATDDLPDAATEDLSQPNEDVSEAVGAVAHPADHDLHVESGAEGDSAPRAIAPEQGPAADDLDEPAPPTPAIVGAWDDAPVDEASDDEGLFSEDAPAPAKGRLGRKQKAGGATPKRKQARGNKGGKGRRVVGLKIGASQIAAAVVAEGDGGPELLELARRPLASGIVVDGEVRDVEALSNALKAFFDDEKLPKKDVRIGLASNRIGVRTFDIVGIDDETKFDNAVRFKAHEVLPVAAHESVLDYRVLEERPNEAGEPLRRVLLVVAPRDQVEPYVEVANRAGIKLAGVDLQALGLLRAFVEPKPFAVRAVDDTATVVVAIGHESSTLLVSGGGVCEFTRVFNWGGAALEEAIATTLEVHPAEATTILRHLSLSGPGRQFDALDEASRARALDAVRLRLNPFARELVTSLQFYQTQSESLGIGGILITGGASHLEGFAGALHEMIGVNVSVGDPLSRVRRAGEFDPAIEAVIGSMAVPIGLAIDDLSSRGVDLLPKDAVRSNRRIPDLKKVAIPVAVAVPFVALGFLYMGAHGKVADTTAALDAVNAELAALPEPTGPDIDQNVQGDEAARATAVASVLGGRLAWDAVFRDLARVIPANVSLTSLSATLPEGGTGAAAAAAAPASTPGEPPSAVVIEGYTSTQPDVARLLARLSTLPSLRRVTLTSSQVQTVSQRDVVQFSIVADLNQTGGQS
jgi:type IV pilus assembly protein PilM